MALMELLRPGTEHLASYLAALQRRWSPDSLRPEAAAEEEQRLTADPQAFLASKDDREGRGPPVRLPDGSTAARLPGFIRWMWDGEFCGIVGLRWQVGTMELPPHCLGHVGYSVVPWQRNKGYATSALRQLLPLAREVGLPYVEVTTDIDNVASQRVILANGGKLIEQFTKPAAHGSQVAVRFHILLEEYPRPTGDESSVHG
jgi:predicted acetyltransferase